MRLGARAGHALFAVAAALVGVLVMSLQGYEQDTGGVAAVLVGALLGGYVARAMKTRQRRRGDPGPGPR